MTTGTSDGSISDQTPSLITSDPQASVLIPPWCLALLSHTPIFVPKCWWVLIAQVTTGVTSRWSSAGSAPSSHPQLRAVASPLSSALWIFITAVVTGRYNNDPIKTLPAGLCSGHTGWIHGLNWGTLRGVGPYYLFCRSSYWIRPIKMISSVAKRLCLLLRRGVEIQSKRLDLKRNWLPWNIRALINNGEIYGGIYFGV